MREHHIRRIGRGLGSEEGLHSKSNKGQGQSPGPSLLEQRIGLDPLERNLKTVCFKKVRGMKEKIIKKESENNYRNADHKNTQHRDAHSSKTKRSRIED